MLYRAVGRVLLCLPAAAPRAAAVIPALDEIRRGRSNLAREQEPKPPRKEKPGRPVRPPVRPDTIGDPGLARSMRPRPGFDTAVGHHNPFALFELYLGPAREYSRRRLAEFLGCDPGAIPCN